MQDTTLRKRQKVGRSERGSKAGSVNVKRMIDIVISKVGVVDLEGMGMLDACCEVEM